jgi:hypothetical protein
MPPFEIPILIRKVVAFVIDQTVDPFDSGLMVIDPHKSSQSSPESFSQTTQPLKESCDYICGAGSAGSGKYERTGRAILRPLECTLREAENGCAYVDEIVRASVRPTPFQSFLYPWPSHLNLKVLTNASVERIDFERSSLPEWSCNKAAALSKYVRYWRSF